MKVGVKDIAGKVVSDLEVSDRLLAEPLNESLLHSVVKGYRANRRQGTHATKTRSFVSGTGKKPFKQKGTGGARQGSLRGPHMPGGAIVHGPQPRCYREKQNRKALALATRVAISDRFRSGTLTVVDDFQLEQPNTKHVEAVLKNLGLQRVVIADARADSALFLSARNIHGVKVVPAAELNAEHILRYENLLLSSNAMKSLDVRLGGDKP